MKRRTIVQTSLAAGLVAGIVAFGLTKDDTPLPGKDVPWRQIAWPFPRDAWLPGQAGGAARSKSMCDQSSASVAIATPGPSPTTRSTALPTSTCWTNAFAPAKEGLAVRLGALSGRARLYRHTVIGGGTRHAEGIAVSQRCDLVIAVIVGNLLDERERTAAYRHLESSLVQSWISQQLEGTLIP